MSWIFNKGCKILAFERLKDVMVFRDKLLDTEKFIALKVDFQNSEGKQGQFIIHLDEHNLKRLKEELNEL